jgi:hypothetical protein
MQPVSVLWFGAVTPCGRVLGRRTAWPQTKRVEKPVLSHSPPGGNQADTPTERPPPLVGRPTKPGKQGKQDTRDTVTAQGNERPRNGRAAVVQPRSRLRTRPNQSRAQASVTRQVLSRREEEVRKPTGPAHRNHDGISAPRCCRAASPGWRRRGAPRTCAGSSRSRWPR